MGLVRSGGRVINALMNIQVRVVSAAALAQLRAVEAQSRRTAVGGIGAMNRQAQYGIPLLSKWGNQVQWAGRQLMYNFTLPIALAGLAATKFALDNERAMVRVSKVYGDGSAKMNRLAKTEIPALAEAFEALSNQFGVHQAEVINIAGDWAAAGASGLALAKVVKLTLETMVLGELSAAEATKNLIAIQAQYGFSTAQLTKTIDVLNMAENQTGTTMKDLMTGLARAAGVARTAGIDVEHLTAMIAALVPATGTAATAGNGLKTMISRIIAPTEEAVDIMRAMKVEVGKSSWEMLNGTERIEQMAEAYNNLSDKQKTVAATYVASRYQLNRFSVLMDAINNKNSYYWKTLDAVDDRQKIFNQRQKELNQVLTSNPQRIQQAWVILQNAMADVIVPLLPYITYLASEIARMANAFAGLDGGTQKLVLALLAFVAIIGPVARYVGAVSNMVGLLTAATHWFAVKMGLASTSVLQADGSFKKMRGGLVGLLRMFTIGPILAFTGAIGAMATGMLKAAGSVITHLTRALGITVATEANATKATITAAAKRAQAVRAAAATMATDEIKSNAARAASTATTAAQTVASEQAAATERLFVGRAGSTARVATETAAQAAQTATVVQGVLVRISEEQAEQARRTFFVDGGGAVRTAAEMAEQVQRTFIVDSHGTARAAYEAAAEETRTTLALTAGSTRVRAEDAFEAARVFVVNRYGVARAVSEQAAEVQRVIAVTAGGEARVTTEAAVAGQILALNAGYYGNMLALEAGGQAKRTFMVTAAAEARVVNEKIELETRLYNALRFVESIVGIETTGATQRLAAELAYYGRASQALLAYQAFVLARMQAMNVVMIQLQAGTYMTLLEIQAAASATESASRATALTQMVAIEAAARSQIAAIQAGAAASTLALTAGTSATVITYGVATAAATTKAHGGAAVGVVSIWSKAMVALRAIFMKLPWMMIGLWAAAAAAVIAVVYAMRDKIADAFREIVSTVRDVAPGLLAPFAPVGDFFNKLVQQIVDAFWALPTGVRNALLTVLTMVRDVALQIYEWMSYLNPFVRHSPSLVESVTRGMDVITDQYARAAGVGGIFRKAAADLAAFKRATQGLSGGEWSDERKDVKKAAPGALPEFNALIGDLQVLNNLMARQEEAVSRQQAVVDRWQQKLDAANDALDRQQDKLDILNGRLTALQDRYDMHSAALQNFADAPIRGMSEMNEQIFQNEMAQKRLQLQMSRWQQANGSVDSLRNRLGLLYGEIEMLQGRASELRLAGAGSEVLGPITDQIRALEAQAKATTSAVNNSPVDKMQAELDKLKQEGDLLQLQFDVKFDPLTHQIENLANAQEELSFNQIVTGIQQQQAAMEQLAPHIEAATQAVNQQQGVVDRLTSARDRLQRRYDVEQKALDSLNAKYERTADLVRDIEGALRDMASAATDALGGAGGKGKLGGKGAEVNNALAAFNAGEGANFPNVGGKGTIGREGGLKGIEKFVEQTIAEMNGIFGGFDMFEPIKKWWKKTWDWIKTNLGPVAETIGSGLEKVFGKIPNPFNKLEKVKPSKGLMDGFSAIVDFFRTVVKWAKKAFDLIGPPLERIGNAIIGFYEDMFAEVVPELKKFGPVISGMGTALKNLWKIAKPIFGLLIVAWTMIGSRYMEIISRVIGPVFDTFVDLVRNLVRIVRGFFEIIVGIVSLDGGMILQGIKDLFGGIFWAVVDTFKNLGRVAIGLFEGFIMGIWNFAVWLWDVLFGHSIIPDIINGFFEWFGKLADLAVWVWKHVLKPLWNAFQDLWDKVKPWLKAWWTGIKAEWSILKRLAMWAWDNVLKPVWDKIQELWDKVKPELTKWWERIVAVWNALKAVARWVWDNVLRPVFDKIKELWSEKVKPELAEWRNRIERAWDTLTAIWRWVKDNVMDPVFDAFKDGWTKIKDWFANNTDIIVKPIQTAVRGVVNAINWIIKGLNKLDALPGIEISISTLTLPFEQGGTLPGRRVMGGWRTQGARAIVGEGKANYPEYVIPTDPTYRNRAQGLMAQAADKLGMTAIPAHAMGGILGSFDVGDIVDIADVGWDKLKDLGAKAVTNIMDPMLAKAAGIDTDWSVTDQVNNLVVDVSKKYVAKLAEEFAEQFKEKKKAYVWNNGGTNFPVQGGDWTPMSFRGHTMDRGQVRAVLAAERMIGQQFNISQGSYSTSVGASAGTHAGGGAFDSLSPNTLEAQTALRMNGQAAWLRTSAQGPWVNHIHSLHIGDPNLSPAAASQVFDFLNGGNGLAGAARGALVKATRDGSILRVGEGGRDEAILPLPHNWRSDAWGGDGSGGGTTININGNLEFPNITDGSDAKTFITNLKSLAEE